MAMKNLKVAYIQPIHGSHKDERIEVLFNPAEYSIEKGNIYQSTPLPGLASPVTQFVAGNADTLSMELFFDTYAPSSHHAQVVQGEDVRNYTKKLAMLVDIDRELHAPPVCRFVWGSAFGSSGEYQFQGIIEKISQKFTLFLADGTPVRARLSVTFREYKTVKEQLEEIGRQSSDRTKRKVIKEGDSLWHFAHSEYEDPALWRVIADKNQIEDPRLLEVGREIALPPLELE